MFGTLDDNASGRDAGTVLFLVVDVGEPGELTVRTGGEAAHRPGERIGLAFGEGWVLFFAEADAVVRASAGGGCLRQPAPL